MIDCPRHYPRDLQRQWEGTDPFSAVDHDDSPHRFFTDRGLLKEILAWYENHVDECGRAFQPIATSIREHLERAD
jgi:hypothetical protein